MSDQTDVLQGTLDLLILRTIALEPMHGWAIAQRIQQISNDLLRVQQGSLYPALHRLEHQGWITADWGVSENNRRARFYSLTRAGRKQVEAEVAKWERLSAGVNLVLKSDVAVRAWHILRSRLRSLVFRDRRESDLSEELQLHLERETERLQATGLSREDARLQARRLFGGVEQIKEAGRDARGTGAWDALVRDTRHGLRRLVRDWRFTTAAVLILGIAIGANTAIFSVVNAVLFRDQAFADPDRLVNIYQNDRAGKPMVVIGYAAYMEMAEYTDIFAGTMAASIPNPQRYLNDGAVRDAVVEYATATYLNVLGLQPSLGRWFDATEERRGAPLVAVLGHQAWTRLFRADPSVVGRVIRMEGVPVTIVGVGSGQSPRHARRRSRHGFLAADYGACRR